MGAVAKRKELTASNGLKRLVAFWHTLAVQLVEILASCFHWHSRLTSYSIGMHRNRYEEKVIVVEDQ